MSDTLRMIPPYVSPRPHSYWAVLALGVSVVVAWVAVGTDWSNLALALRDGAGRIIPTDELRAAKTLRYATSALQLSLLSITAFIFVVWLHRCRLNLRALGARRMDYTTNWSLTSFFVPFLNLVRPYQVTREIWLASNPEVMDSFAWKERPGPWLVLLWWSSFLVFVVGELLTSFAGADPAITPLRLQLVCIVALFSDLAGGVSGSLAIFVVLRLSRAQQEKRARSI